MTASNLTLSRAGYCQALEDMSLAALLKMGLDGQGRAPTTAEAALGITAGDIAAQALELALKGYISFRRSFTCSTNDTVTLELIARGVNMDAGFVRRIDVFGYSVDDAGGVHFERCFGVDGGTTPVVAQFGGSTSRAVQTTNGLATLDVDLERTNQASAEAQTLDMAAGASTLTVTYTGQSGDVTNGYFEVRIYPRVKVTFE